MDVQPSNWHSHQHIKHVERQDRPIRGFKQMQDVVQAADQDIAGVQLVVELDAGGTQRAALLDTDAPWRRGGAGQR